MAANAVTVGRLCNEFLTWKRRFDAAANASVYT
jgi:hypothetical protein